jgi:LPPG:FO 2-phospho-L-lactate transferase
VLAGGVGAARFLRGLTRVIDPRTLTVVGNTADDDEFFGLHVSPDLDTLTYTLAGLAPPRRGWGIAGDTYACLDALEQLYGAAWFRLGDRDLATHIYRTERLRAGERLSRITAALTRRLGVRSTVLPMTDGRVRTFIHTARGREPFQTYLVRQRGRGRVARIEIVGVARARPAPGVLAALRQASLVVIPPSNPLVSIGPILALRGVRRQLRQGRAPVAAISPLIQGRPVRGPADRMLRGLGIDPSPLGVASLYADFVDLFVIDREDAALAPHVAALGCQTLIADTLLSSPRRAAALARRILDALSTLERSRTRAR